MSRNFFATDRTTGDVYYFGEDVDNYKDGKIVNHESAWRAGTGGARFGLMIPTRPTVGQRFFQEIAPKVAMDRVEIVSTSATVKTPAGTFEQCVHLRETTPLESDVSHRYLRAGYRDDQGRRVRADGTAAGGPVIMLHRVCVSVLAVALCADVPAFAQSATRRSASSWTRAHLCGSPWRRRVIIRRVGQPVAAVLVDPVFAYDRVVIPAEHACWGTSNDGTLCRKATDPGDARAGTSRPFTTSSAIRFDRAR